MQPAMQSLSVQSYNNDSPPFTGSTARHLEPVPLYSLDEAGYPRPTTQSPRKDYNTPRAAPFMPPMTEKDGIFSTSAHSTHGTTSPSYFAASLGQPLPRTAGNMTSTPASPNPDSSSFSVISGTDDFGPKGSMAAYAELDRPSRISSPIDLKHEADAYSFPRHRLATSMLGMSLPARLLGSAEAWAANIIPPPDEAKIPLVIGTWLVSGYLNFPALLISWSQSHAGLSLLQHTYTCKRPNPF